ncbi:uncharacterized protein LOC111129787 [Crassostrea virginica]
MADENLYLDPVSRGPIPKSRPAEGPNSADEKTASTPKRVSVEISSSSTSHQSGIYNTLDTGNDQQNYAELNDRHQYEDLHDGRQIYMQNIQNEQSNNTENPKKKRFLFALINFCSVTSVIINCPVGIFSVCYACMAKTERFYPMKRYYLFMTFVVASLAGILFAIIFTFVFLIYLATSY